MNKYFVIIKLNHKFENQKSLEGKKISKIVSSISPLDFIRLLKNADNKVNPRTATVNPVVRSIEETLTVSPELYFFKTKGLLISTQSCETLERNRVKLSFNDSQTEGVMDGGHNAFAIGRFIYKKLYGECKFKEWKELKAFWDNEENYADLEKRYREYPNPEEFKFSIPIEIITPSDNSEESLTDFYDNIADICSARNSNVQLTDAAKSNQRGCYDYLKDIMPSNFQVIWKNGEAGLTKVEDVTALACIPLIKLVSLNYFLDRGTEVGTLSKVSVYSQKNKCVKFFGSVMMNKDISRTEKGKYILQNTTVKSALDLLVDIMRFCDRMYYYFPQLYNYNNGSFGRIKGVLQKPKTTYSGPFNSFAKQSDYKYAYGFFYPIICGLTELMELEDGILRWKLNPLYIDFDDDKIKGVFTQYMNLVRLLDYNPNKVGKDNSTYYEADSLMQKLRDMHKDGCLF
ncbi:MAG: hypothetical protein IJQ05_01310 [Bacteroidaceae bacterium]|nr:hypothetical protein [Bacteroidaceae bacterium]